MRKIVSKGDTLIEVLLGVTVFSMVAVGAMTIMNRGAAIAQQSLEITLVRQQIDGQAEMLRYIHSMRKSSTAEIWGQLKKDNVQTATGDNMLGVDTCASTFQGQDFALYSVAGQIRKTVNYVPAETYAKINGNRSEGISVRLVRSGSGSRKYDAYIQACWMGVGASRPSTIGTIVRLYDPEA